MHPVVLYDRTGTVPADISLLTGIFPGETISIHVCRLEEVW